MARPPTPEQTARAILKTMAGSMRIRGGQGAPVGAVIHNSEAGGVDRQDFQAALSYAIDQGWIQYDADKHWIGLTDAGYAEATP